TISIGKRDIFSTPYHPGKEWIGNIGNNHPYHIGFIPPKTPRELAGLITQLLYCLENTPSQWFSDPGRVVKHVGYSAKRNPRNPGNVLHIRHGFSSSTGSSPRDPRLPPDHLEYR